MFFFNRGEEQKVSIGETVGQFRALAETYVDRGDMVGLRELYSRLCADLLKGLKGKTAERLRARQAMEKALEEVITRPARERRRYFQGYGGAWWRRK